MDQPLVHPLLESHRQKNTASRDRWQTFALHRRRVTDHLVEAAGEIVEPRLLILGAGNCNDLDLPRLRQRFAAIDLVDCDCRSVQEGIARQGLAADSAIQAIGPIDLSNIAECISTWSSDQQISDSDASLALEAASRRALLPAPPSDVVASVCLLSQILDDLGTAVGSTNPRFLSLLQQVRNNHFQLLINQLKPDGTGLFISDLVSSDSAPQIVSATALTLPHLLQQLVEHGNFFTGLNPAVIYALLTNDPQLSPQITSTAVSQPWLWDFGQRIYAVYAIRFRRFLGG